MLTYIPNGDLFASGCQALVNAVNCQGVMGAGLALQFRRRWPHMYAQYRTVCHQGRGTFQAGDLLALRVTEDGQYPEWIINIATKAHWKDTSRIEWVQRGIEGLPDLIQRNALHSIGIPALGCGLGGLQFSQVRPIIDKVLGSLTDVDIRIFLPK